MDGAGRARGLGTRWASGAALALFACVAVGAGPRPAATPSPAPRAPSSDGSVRFEPNLGQTDARADVLARCRGYVAFLTPTGATLAFEAGAVRLGFARASGRARAVPSAPLEGRSHYFLGQDAARWVRDVPHFAAAACDDLAPGVDVRWRGDAWRLAFDVVLAAGTEPSAARMRFEGAEDVAVAEDGRLAMRVPGGELSLTAPVAWQETGSGRRFLDARWTVDAHGLAAFALGPHDASQAVVVDPTIDFSSYLGGSGNDGATAVGADAAGGHFVVGSASGAGFPVTTGAWQTLTSSRDTFVTRFVGNALAWSTYLGGSNTDQAYDVAVDDFGTTTIVGQTSSTDYPLASPYRSTPGSGFVTRLASSGSALLTSTYVANLPRAVSLDEDREVYVLDDQSATVTKFDADVSRVVWTSVQAGSVAFAWSLAAEPGGAVWCCGETQTQTGFATAGAYDTTHGGGAGDGFLTRIDSSGNRSYTTYYGGALRDILHDVAIDPSGNVVVGGSVGDSQVDAFVLRFSPSGTALQWNRSFSGGSTERCFSVAVSPGGAVYAVGTTSSSDFPVVAATQTSYGGDVADAFVARLDSDGSVLWATYLGGEYRDAPSGLAVNGSGRLVVAGGTPSTNFPTAAAYQSSHAGNGDAFVTVFEESSSPFGTLTPVSLPGVTVGYASSHALSVAGGASPLTWSVAPGSSLPGGFTLSESGTLAGSSLTPLTHVLKTQVRASDGVCAVRLFTITVNALPAVDAASLDDWTAGRPFDFQFTHTGGTAPFAWTVTEGAAPAGLTLATSGALSGTPSSAETAAFTVRVADAYGASATGSFSMRVHAAPEVSTASIPEATRAAEYVADVAHTGGTAPFAWSIAAGALPGGMSLHPGTGALSGAPNVPAEGTHDFDVRVTDARGASAQRSLSLRVNQSPAVAAQTLPFAVPARPYLARLVGSGGTAPHRWELTQPALPPGIALSPAGDLAGTPTLAGRFTFVGAYADAWDAFASRSFALDVADLEDFTKRRDKESVSFAAEGGTAPAARTLELVAGTTLDVLVKLKGRGELPVALELLDAAEQALDLGDALVVKPSSVQVKRFVVPATGRYFLVLRPTTPFDGDVSLDVRVAPPSKWSGTGAVGPAELEVVVAAPPGARVTLEVKATKKSAAVPTVAGVVDDSGAELLVPAELKTSRKGAALRIRTPVAGGDLRIRLAPRGETAGDVLWSVKVAAPKAYTFALPELAAGEAE